MKVGIDMQTNKVVMDVDGDGGIVITVQMTAVAARMAAAQLVSSADTLDIANENGWTEDDISI